MNIKNQSVYNEVNDTIAGYVKAAQNLTFVTVYGAGHFVPMNQPVTSLNMLERFINKTSPTFCYDCVSQSPLFCVLLSNCSNHGSCHNGKCVCDNNHFGIDCSNEIIDVSNNKGNVKSGSLQPMEFNYFEFITTDCNQVTLNSYSTCLYLRKDKAPTEILFDLSHCTSDINSQFITFNSNVGQKWFIGALNYDMKTRNYSLSIDSCPIPPVDIWIYVTIFLSFGIIFYGFFKWWFKRSHDGYVEIN